MRMKTIIRNIIDVFMSVWIRTNSQVKRTWLKVMKLRGICWIPTRCVVDLNSLIIMLLPKKNSIKILDKIL